MKCRQRLHHQGEDDDDDDDEGWQQQQLLHYRCAVQLVARPGCAQVGYIGHRYLDVFATPAGWAPADQLSLLSRLVSQCQVYAESNG